MYEYKWILPSLKEILVSSGASLAECSLHKARQQWRTAASAAQELLLNSLSVVTPVTNQGLVLAAPAPVLCESTLLECLRTVTFTAKPFNPLALMPFQMSDSSEAAQKNISDESVLPLLRVDPLAKEQFCLIFTKKFSLILVLAEESNDKSKFLFSFDPEVISQAWQALAGRVMLTNPDLFVELDNLVQEYYPVAPDYRLVMQFSQLLLAKYPETEDRGTKLHGKGAGEFKSKVEESHCSSYSTATSTKPSSRSDVELLQAFAHEVRTPLTTIRTTTRLLLKQKDLPANVTKRLQSIDRECTEQIDRMELLFRAAELETSSSQNPSNSQLTSMCLEQMLQQSIPRWRQAANRRNLTLDVLVPQQLPAVVTNPGMLDRVLTGLMENFTRNLPAGSNIQVRVIQAGDQLKLQLLPNSSQDIKQAQCSNTPPIRKAIGQLLMFQPETGTISLNLAATKHLFQAIGGKLIVRERPQHGEILTIYLPLEGVNNSNSCFDKFEQYGLKKLKEQRLKVKG
ncbi:histidine kinase [Rivularia sp. PCC 7116]|uniref:histidine kinase dimerization/phospho-acceptor domain-containing protein n=1 Tax=Rivularia sp. PCC 7116 TaxID=373994 RepID=UPI00029F47DC|nr:histidine kinase dimerization/phospho-acceptor domain-containing protein [Rivularia sp. PCC 7116]AFY58400.1 histidine kinase [Rivularia sp. PCC 7116]